jgi:hypothetical protein
VIALRAPGAGAPLAGAVRAPLERSLGIDLGAVRVHGDAAARAAVAATGARALAFGPRIFLGPRESGADLGVMAHEVAHVVQQQGGATVQRLGGDTGGLEREAVAAAGAVGRGEAFEVTGRTRARPMFLFDSLRRAAGAVVGAVGDVIGTALGWVRERANAIPGYRLISLILRRDPLTGEAVAFSTANLLRAMLELNPIGTVIRVALDRYGIVDRVAGFVDQQMATLAGVLGSIGGAVMAFLRSLGPLDIVSPGAVIDRARRLIEEPIARMRAFIGTLTEGIATFVRDAVLRPLAELASRTRAWDLLCAVLGRNPITGEAVARNAETLIGGFMKLIGQEEVWENIKRGNAVARAWAWFQGTLAGVLAFVRELPQRFLDTLRSLSIGDLVAPLAAFGRIASTFGAFVGQFLGWAGGQVVRLLEIIVEVVAPAILPYLKRAAGAFGTIIRDPIRFVGNLVRAALTGFRQFGTNILDHLRTGLIGWLTGAMGGTGVHIPTALSLSEILKFVLSVLGLTWQAVRLRLVRVVGEPVVAGLEQGFDMVRRLVTEGPAAAWQMIVEAVGNLRDMVVEQVMGFVRSRIVQAAITRLIASLNPAGAFIQAILAIYNTIMFLVERLQQIAQVAAGVIDSIAAIAGGVISQAANAVERTAARLLPVVIAFLARLIGLGNVGEVVTRFLDRVRRPIERALERLVNWIVAQARRLGRAVVGAGRRGSAEPTPEEGARLDGALTAARALIAARGANVSTVESGLPVIRQRFALSELRLVRLREGAFAAEAAINPRRRGVPDPLFTEAQLANLRRLGQEIAAAIRADRADNWSAEYRADKMAFLRNPRRVTVGRAVEEAGAPVVEQIAEEGGFTMLRNVALNLVDNRQQVLGGTQAEIDYLVLGRRRVEEIVSAKLNPAQLRVATDRRALAHYRDFPQSGSVQQIQEYAQANFGRTPMWNNAVGAIVTHGDGRMPLAAFRNAFMSRTVVESVTVRVLSPTQPGGGAMPAIPLRANEVELFTRLAQFVDEAL